MSRGRFVVRSVSAVVPVEYHDRLVLGVPSFGTNWVVSTEGGWGGVALWALGYDDAEAWDGLVDAARRDLAP